MDTFRAAASLVGLGTPAATAAAPTMVGRLLRYAPHPYLVAASGVAQAGQLVYGVYESVQRSDERRTQAKEAEVRSRAATIQLKEIGDRLRDADTARFSAEQKARDAEVERVSAVKGREAAEAAAALARILQEKAEERWMKGIPPEAQPTEQQKRYFRQRYRIQSDKTNIAIVGESGMGKSSLLNSLCGVSVGHPNAAASGFNETTAVVKGYPDPRYPNVIWYDVPGANTPSVQGWTYFVEQGLFVFDVLVVVFADRFSQTVGTLISNANKCSIPAFIVRTKSDQLISNARNDSPHHLSGQAAKDVVVIQTREMVKANLLRLQLPNQRVYIVSKAAMKKLVLRRWWHRPSLIDEQTFLDDILPFNSMSSNNAIPLWTCLLIIVLVASIVLWYLCS